MSEKLDLSIASIVPDDGSAGLLVGRAWIPDPIPGPSPVALANGAVHDLTSVGVTCAEILNLPDPAAAISAAVARGKTSVIGRIEDFLANSDSDRRDKARPWFLAPCDLQAIKACGVTFVGSMLERVIEEQAGGDPAKAEALREAVFGEIGTQLHALKPGSAEAARLKELLIEKGQWSQYLEVGIGPDAEVFSKAQPMSAVGIGASIGIHPKSEWNNPEPELVLAINSAGDIVGATLGNDVNLRDFEGRSALLLGRSKDNNGSCAIGPFIRLIDDTLSLDDLRSTGISTEIRGRDDGFRLATSYSMAEISRDPADLVTQSINEHHQYPDGLMLFLGTMFAPIQDRGEAGKGFTHKLGDTVAIRSTLLGTLTNRVNHTDCLTPWRFGTLALMRNLAARGLLKKRDSSI